MIAPPVVLRRPHPHEAPALADLHVLTWKQTYEHLLPTEFFNAGFRDGRLQLWRSLLARERGPRGPWVAEHSHRLVGFALASPVNDQNAVRPVELHMLYVLREFHGGGTGQKLLDAVLGDDPALVWVARDNPRAHRFYERNGFFADGAESPADAEIPTLRMVR